MNYYCIVQVNSLFEKHKELPFEQQSFFGTFVKDGEVFNYCLKDFLNLIQNGKICFTVTLKCCTASIICLVVPSNQLSYTRRSLVDPNLKTFTFSIKKDFVSFAQATSCKQSCYNRNCDNGIEGTQLLQKVEQISPREAGVQV